MNQEINYNTKISLLDSVRIRESSASSGITPSFIKKTENKTTHCFTCKLTNWGVQKHSKSA